MKKIIQKNIVNFWYSDKGRQCWYQSTPKLDQYILAKYESVWQGAINGDLQSWKASAEGCLALAIVLDQFPLNMFRGKLKSFSSLTQAIAIVHFAIECGFDQLISHDQVSFLYAPLMHSEDLVDQELSVKLFTQNNLIKNIRYAVHHRDIVKEFGRFPHRNAILERESTVQEVTYLNSRRAFKG